VDAMFALTGPALARLLAKPRKAFGLHRRDKTDPSEEEHPAARAFRYAVHTLGVAPPELYFRPQQPVAVEIVSAIDRRKNLIPAFIVGGTLLSRPREKELVFELSKRLSFLRPERFIRYALPSADSLDSALRAGLSASGASNGAPLDGETARLVEHLRRALPAARLDQVRSVGRKLIESNGPLVDLTAWLTASDLTASRAAFALVNDFEAAARMVSIEPAGMSQLTAKDRLRELLLFSISEDYFAVRKHLGVEVEVGSS